MNINIFDDPTQVPQPRQNVFIKSIQALPYSDRFRVRIDIHVTAFQERPNLLIVMRDIAGHIVNEQSVIATMHTNMEFTVHMRHAPDPSGDYTVSVELYYDSRNPPQDLKTTSFNIPAE